MGEGSRVSDGDSFRVSGPSPASCLRGTGESLGLPEGASEAGCMGWEVVVSAPLSRAEFYHVGLSGAGEAISVDRLSRRVQRGFAPKGDMGSISVESGLFTYVALTSKTLCH